MTESKYQKEDSDYLGSFLKAVKGEPSEASSGSASEPGLLKVLVESGGTMSVDDLRSASGLAFDDFASRFQSLRNAKLIVLRGDPGYEVVVLTEEGKALVS